MFLGDGALRRAAIAKDIDQEVVLITGKCVL